MAGSIVFTDSKLRTVRKFTLAWLSDASGDVNSVLTIPLSGVLERITFDPDGTDVPSANYDVVLNDVDGVDVLNGKGSNLSATVTTSVAPALTGGNMAFDDALDLVVTNAGNAKRGKVILYIR